MLHLHLWGGGSAVLGRRTFFRFRRLLFIHRLGGLLAFLVLFLEQLARRHGAVGHLGDLQDVVDHLVLEDRRAQVVARAGLLAVIIHHFALMAGIATHLLAARPADLLPRAPALVTPAHFSKARSQAHAP